MGALHLVRWADALRTDIHTTWGYILRHRGMSFYQGSVIFGPHILSPGYLMRLHSHPHLSSPTGKHNNEKQNNFYLFLNIFNQLSQLSRKHLHHAAPSHHRTSGLGCCRPRLPERHQVLCLHPCRKGYVSFYSHFILCPPLTSNRWLPPAGEQRHFKLHQRCSEDSPPGLFPLHLREEWSNHCPVDMF